METKVETTDVEKFKKRTPSAIRCLAFFKAKEGKGGELERVLAIRDVEVKRLGLSSPLDRDKLTLSQWT